MTALRICVAAATAIAVLVAAGAQAARSQLRVALVLDAGTSRTEDDIAGAVYRAFSTVINRPGVAGRVVFTGAQRDPATALTSLGRQRYDLVVTGFVPADLVGRVASAFPRSRFLMPFWSIRELPHKPKNVAGAVFHEEQAGYLAGYLAALVTRKEGKRVISSVGGVKIADVDAFIAGYQAGARRAYPRVETLNAYSGDFAHPSRCEAVARDEIARGSRVVFGVAGRCSLGALRAAKAKGAWGVGVDVDQSHRGAFILTSAVKNAAREVSDAVRALRRGTFKTGGDRVFDLRNGGVGLGRISPRVPPALVRRVDAVRRAIVDGRIKPPSRVR